MGKPWTSQQGLMEQFFQSSVCALGKRRALSILTCGSGRLHEVLCKLQGHPNVHQQAVNLGVMQPLTSLGLPEALDLLDNVKIAGQ